jgi:SAM-dependent methyltransferase
MITAWLQKSGKPALFEKGTSQMWTDEYISRQLLDSHLNPESDAASRTPERIDQTVHWIDRFICEQNYASAILDLGCGPGLYTQRLAKMGYRVTGIDFSTLSIEYAKQRAASEELEIFYINEDYIHYNYPAKYATILMIYCDFGVLDESSKVTLLSKVYEALQPGGVFVFDVFRPQRYAGYNDSRTWSCSEGGFWRPGPHLCLHSGSWYEESGIHLDQYIIFEDTSGLEIYNIWDKTYTVEEISALLKQQGFVDPEFYNSFSGEAMTEEHDTLCVIARKAKQ